MCLKMLRAFDASCYIACRGNATSMPDLGIRKNGAGDRSRTDDFDLGKVALYQLSYTRPAGPDLIL
jgi:hypothetical protein